MSDPKKSDNSCKNLIRTHPVMVSQKEIEEVVGPNFRLLPTFEKTLYEYTYLKHYSLKNNEFLKCNWEKYKRNIESRVIAPFQFLDIRDYHFYSCRNRLKPDDSIHTKTDFRRKLIPGPGVDQFGQLPIPQELHMKRGTQKSVIRKSRNIKNGTKDVDKKKVGVSVGANYKNNEKEK